jgi:hypothetical protein
MPLPFVRNVVRLGIGLLGPIAVAAALAGPASAAALDPTVVQVQYMPQDGAAIVLWSPVDKATGYNVYEQIVSFKEGTPSTASAAVKVNTAPVDAKTTSFMVPGLKNGTPYHFTITAIVDGAETDPVGPSGKDDTTGELVAVVPQTPVKLAGIDGFYGYNIGTDLPGAHTVTTDATTGAQTIAVTGSGWDINNPADGFYFLAAPVKGDVTVTARILSGPTDTPDAETDWNLGGVQIRASLDAGAELAMTQAARVGKAQFKYRDTYAGPGNEEDEDDSVAGHEGGRRPIWVRVVRKGNDFSGALSDDGKTWTTLDQSGTGGVHTVPDMPATAYAGLAISAHADSGGVGYYSTAVFDNFTITPTP